MKTHALKVPEIGLIALTRAVFGAGVGLLVADKISPEQRRTIGWTLVAVGALTTIPIGMEILGSDRGDG